MCKCLDFSWDSSDDNFLSFFFIWENCMKNKKLKQNEERKIGIEKMKIDVKMKRKKAGKIEEKESKNVQRNIERK